MRLALIPPLKNVYTIMNTNYQLALPHLLGEGKYMKAYLKARRHGSYVILDNGVAEGEEYSHLMIRELAIGMMANEIVLPDAMGDMQKTLSLVRNAYMEDMLLPDHFNYMAVVQGQTFQECYELIDWYCRQPFITTIGIPRHLITTLEQLAARFLLAQYIRERSERMQIHLLGTNPTYIKEVLEYGNAFRRMRVRGVDTSAPFNYALQHELLEAGANVARPEDFFQETRIKYGDTAEGIYAGANINTMKDWVAPTNEFHLY